MNDEIKNKIDSLKNIRLKDTEKSHMLHAILSTPVESPFFKFIKSPVWVSLSVLVLTFSTAIFASGSAIPGDILYPIKTEITESLLDVVRSAPAEKIIWEEEKINRRIVEAEKLVEKNKLDEKKLKKLETKIEKSSVAFSQTVEIVASSTTTSTSSAKERAKNLRQELRSRLDKRGKNSSLNLTNRKENRESDERQDQEERINRLRDRAIEILDRDRD